jgi:PAS domain S-box-containing protein
LPAKSSDSTEALRRLEDENEQLRVAFEEQSSQLNALALERQELVQQLAAAQQEQARLRSQLLRENKEKMDALGERLNPFSFKLMQDSARMTELEANEEELRVALEEMQVLAEELEDTNTALTLANQELDERVARRTAELHSANGALRRSEQRLRLAQSVASAVVWDWDGTQDTFTWSGDFASLHGISGDEGNASGQAWLESIHSEDRGAVEKALLECLEHGVPDFAAEYRVRQQTGQERWLAARGKLLLNDQGHPHQLVGLTMDVTERKLAELTLAGHNETLREQVRTAMAEREAAQIRMFQAMKLEALGQLTGGVAHDFNNLLAVIISGLSLISRSQSEEERASLSVSIEQAARRGAKLIRRLLSFARRQTLKPEALDMEGWLTEMAALLKPSLRPDIDVVANAAPGTAAMVDRGELELALLNLCLNARDAMPEPGTLTIGVRTLHLAPGEDPDGLTGPFVELRVTDTGEGMSEPTQARIFEPFFTTKPAGQGTGLGLPQVYGFAKQSGGTARVESTLGKGTTIRLLLPAATSLNAGPGRPQPSAFPGAERSLRVLVVEDDPEVCEMAVRVLRKLGHQVQQARNTEEAMDTLDRGEIDLMFTDIMLADGGDGLNLALTAKRRWPQLPVLLTTGYEASPERMATAKLPLLRKPYDAEELDRAINGTVTATQAMAQD